MDTSHLETVMDSGHGVTQTVPIHEGSVMLFVSPTQPLRHDVFGFALCSFLCNRLEPKKVVTKLHFLFSEI